MIRPTLVTTQETAEQQTDLGVLAHEYRNASDDVAAFDADEADRQGVTVTFAFHQLIDIALWLWREVDISGDDPWTLLSGIDRLVQPDADGNEYIIEWGRTSQRRVKPSFRLFAQRRDLRQRNIILESPDAPAPT